MLKVVDANLTPMRDVGCARILVSRRKLYDELYRLNAYQALLEAQIEGVL